MVMMMMVIMIFFGGIAHSLYGAKSDVGLSEQFRDNVATHIEIPLLQFPNPGVPEFLICLAISFQVTCVPAAQIESRK